MRIFAKLIEAVLQANIRSGIDLRIQAFVKLGQFLRDYVRYSTPMETAKSAYEKYFESMDHALARAEAQNGWYTKEQVRFALEQWGELLRESGLYAWIGRYDLKENRSRTVAIVSAGNIPLVGFHDFLCVLITGNKVLVKNASNDSVLLPFLADWLINIEPTLNDQIEFAKGFLGSYDAVIATGSNNTARYFEYYFGKKPHIIRKNRNSVAVLQGTESREQLKGLAEDVFRYFGLGCRSVSKIFVPPKYNFDLLFNAFYQHRGVLEHVKYANNYEYNKAVFLMSEFDFLDNGFFMLKEDHAYASPIASLFFEYYDQREAIRLKLKKDTDLIQCVVAEGLAENEVPFGLTQQPRLNDYADGVDTVDFLLRT